MHPGGKAQGTQVEAETLARIQDLYERGLYFQAYQQAISLGPIAEWRGTDACVLGGRLANNLGSGKLARRLHIRARREDRAHAEAAYYYGLIVYEDRGPMAALAYLDRLKPLRKETDASRADVLALRARSFGKLRDFDRAEKHIAEAIALAGRQAWVLTEYSGVQEDQDCYEEALATAKEALDVHPWFRPAVQQTAHLLQLVGKDDEAYVFLEEASERLESPAVLSQFAVLLEERGEHQRALTAWRRARELAPFSGSEEAEWWSARLADAHYQCGDLLEAESCARAVNIEFYTEFAERLATATGKTRVLLPVPFIRQHHMTCAPATLSAISRYWKQPVDHLALAAEICYDGTQDHVERDWAERNGYVVREFTVTWESAVQLLDRGVPLTLTTTETTSAHLQAVVGYDTIRRVLLIRDPFQRIHREFAVEKLLKRYAAFGPRGMLLVPGAERHSVDDLLLPDSTLYDCYYDLQRGLHVHDRARAQAAFDRLESIDANHRLMLFAERVLASYDGSLSRQLAATERLLEAYPDNLFLRWVRIVALRELAQPGESRTALHEAAILKESEPLFRQEWAQELARDARQLPMARRWALRALSVRPTDPANLAAFAGVCWDLRQFERAAEFYRAAAFAGDKSEDYSRSWFIAARHVRQVDLALAWLELRFQRFKAKSSQPVQLLFWALSLLGRDTEASARLEEGLAARPQDGDLLLFATDSSARRGNLERADQLLASAEPRARRASWLRTAAVLADYRCDRARAERSGVKSLPPNRWRWMRTRHWPGSLGRSKALRERVSISSAPVRSLPTTCRSIGCGSNGLATRLRRNPKR